MVGFSTFLLAKEFTLSRGGGGFYFFVEKSCSLGYLLCVML